MKYLIARILFGKPLIMSVYKDQNGNYYGGVIHPDKKNSYIDNVSHIDNPVFMGKTKIYI